ncbi:MAG: hypothetical protein AAFQ28_03190 [Pseudomonadota bacterium]
MPQYGRAEFLPGASDPNLARAAHNWLMENEPSQAMHNIGQLASDGNVAAQFFANRIYNDPFGTTELSKIERLNLFPPVEGDTRDSRFRPYEIEHASFPILSLRFDLDFDQPLPQILEAADMLFEAGFKQALYGQFLIAFQNADIDIEAFEIGSRYVLPTDRHSIDYWGFLILAMSARDTFADKKRAISWIKPAEDLLEQIGFYETLRSGGFSALRVVGLSLAHKLPHVATELDTSDFASVVYNFRRIAEKEEGSSDITSDRLTDIGTYVEKTLEQAPYLRPARDLCALACGKEKEVCLGCIILTRDYRTSIEQHLEAVITAEKFYTSLRAQREVLSNVRHRLRDAGSLYGLFPSCLKRVVLQEK